METLCAASDKTNIKCLMVRGEQPVPGSCGMWEMDGVSSAQQVPCVWLFSPQTIPFYIFSESYGGKMAAGVALELHKVSTWRT